VFGREVVESVHIRNTLSLIFSLAGNAEFWSAQVQPVVSQTHVVAANHRDGLGSTILLPIVLRL
jgi:hypothetical protein